MVRITITVLAILLLAGCSSRGIYEGIQISNKQACANLPPADYEDCLEANSKSYDEYQRELEQVSK